MSDRTSTATHRMTKPRALAVRTILGCKCEQGVDLCRYEPVRLLLSAGERRRHTAALIGLHPPMERKEAAGAGGCGGWMHGRDDATRCDHIPPAWPRCPALPWLMLLQPLLLPDPPLQAAAFITQMEQKDASTHHPPPPPPPSTYSNTHTRFNAVVSTSQRSACLFIPLPPLNNNSAQEKNISILIITRLNYKKYKLNNVHQSQKYIF